MFTKLKTLKKFSNQHLTIDELVGLIKDNPLKDKIEHLRSIEYKSSEYKNLKTKFPCILPAGIFSGLKNNDLQFLSGYLYYDIDDTFENLNDTINKLNESFPITLLCKSVGGRGISLLIKVNEITIENYQDIYFFIRKQLIDKGFNIDCAASGIARKMIISSDEGIIYNKEVSFNLNKVSFKMYKKDLCLNKIKIFDGIMENTDIQPRDTFDCEIIPYKELMTQISTQTLYTKEFDTKYNIDSIDYYRILIPKQILDGTKHKLYIRIVNALYYINPLITDQQLISYLFHINNLATPKMKLYELKKLMSSTSKIIKETGEIRIKPGTKKIHFNMNNKMTPKEKMSLGATINNALRTNKTLQLIYDTKMMLCSKNIEPTQKLVVEQTGLSIATVKRNWNKQMIDIENIKVEKKKELKIQKQVEFIDEDDWFASLQK